MAEDRVLGEDLGDRLGRRPDRQVAVRRTTGLELGARQPRPAALAADARHRLGVGLVEGGGRFLRRVGEEAVAVDPQRQSGGILAGALGGFAVKVGDRRETSRLAADDRQSERQAQSPGARDRLRRAADRDPDRQRILQRARIDAKALQRRAKPPLPSDALVGADREQQVKLLGKQFVVVVEIVTKKGKRTR